MDDSTQFNLNVAIQAWRGNLESSPALSRDNVDELESNLRDATATLAAKGLSTEEAFLVACRRMGAGEALEREYGKVNRERVWLDRALWGIIGWVVVVALSSFVSGLITCVTMLGALTALPGNARSALYGFAHLAALIGVTLGLWRVCRKNGGQLERMAFWLRQHPVWAAILVGMILVGSKVFANGMNVLIIRIVPVNTFRELTWWGILAAGLIPVVFWPVLLGWILQRSSPKKMTSN